jgi:hypothetical protein
MKLRSQHLSIHHFLSVTTILVVGIMSLLAENEAVAGQVVQCATLIRSVQNPNVCVKARSPLDRAEVVLDLCPADTTMDTNFFWSFFDVGNPNHDHFIRLTGQSGKRRMEVQGWSHDDHGLIQIWGPNIDIAENANNQKWRVEPHGEDTVALISVLSNKCLDAPLFDNNIRAGDQLQQFSCNFRRNQLWIVRDQLPCNRNAE